jgi:hypothetical protein
MRVADTHTVSNHLRARCLLRSSQGGPQCEAFFFSRNVHVDSRCL